MTKGRPWTKKEVKEFADTLIAVTIPVNVTIEGKQKILSLEEMERLLRSASAIAITNCQCRERVKGCDAPVDVCLYLNKEAEAQIKDGTGKKIALKQAMDVLRRTNDAGLVHMAYIDKGDKEPNYVCSCCACCCHSFKAIQKFGFNDAVISSEMIAAQDDKLCNDCGVCVDRCHFKARSMKNDSLVYDKSKCFGCGLCVQYCPTEAISLERR